MTKRHVTMIQQAYRAVLSDISDDLPETSKGVERDFSRLCSAVEKHGLRFFTLDLVECGKHFDKCLAHSLLTRFKGPHMRSYKKSSVIPRLFRGLLMRVFDDSGTLQSVPCIKSIRYLRQLYYLAKKWKIECEKERTYNAVQSFFDTDARVLQPTLDWASDCLDLHGAFHLDYDDKLRVRSSDRQQLNLELGDEQPWLPKDTVRAIHFASDCITFALGVFDTEEWGCRHGPGAVSDRDGRSKFDFPTWPLKLESVFPLSRFACANYGIWVDELVGDSTRCKEQEAPCKLIAVPKTQKAPRLIASEPTAHQWCQQLVKDYLYTRTNRSWLGGPIKFSDQTVNQKAARQASQTGSHWTIDLSEASDRVSCYVVERFFRRNPELLKAFHACRTRFISNDIDENSPKLHRLRKFSCMGSALTFPVQSLVFLGIVLGSMLSQRKLRYSIENLVKLSREVQIFGDDLIVPEDSGHLVLGALRYLGFKVNRSKTFSTGRFRESCGGEYFAGHDVTPTYLLTYPDRRRPESLVSCVETRNNLYRNGYSRAAQYLKSTIQQASYIKLPVVPSDSGLFGWASYDGYDLRGLVTRFNKHLHRREMRVHYPSGRVTSLPDRYGSHLLQYFSEAPSPDQPWSSGVRGRPALRLKSGWVAVV